MQGVQFLFGLILARLLSPEEFGLVGMLAIFIVVAQTFVDGGFANALIRNNKRKEVDFSTAFYFNIVVGIVTYLILYISSPYIADFYKMPILEDLAKVLCLNVFINSLGVVQRAKFTIAVNFKSQAKATITSVLVSGLIGIYLAYSGFGVWALVVQSVSQNFLNVCLLWILSRWVPKAEFSVASFKSMFNYGHKILLSALINNIFVNITTLVVGKVYSATYLGNYTRAKQFAAFPSANLTGILGRVTFPILSSIQDDDTRLEKVYRKYLRLMAFIVFPLMMGLAALSKPLILLLLTDKWAAAIPYLQIMCFAMMWYPVHAINLNLLEVKGRSDLFLRIEIIKKIIGVSVLFITIPMGIIYLIIGSVFSSLVSLVINTHYTSKLLKLGFWTQMRDLFPTLLLSLFMGVVVFCSSLLFQDMYLIQLLVGIIVGVFAYALPAYFLKMEEFSEIISLLKLKKQ